MVKESTTVPKQAISVVVPTLNEAENIPHLLSRIDRSLKASDIPYEVIIVDDHSSDNTLQVADNLSSTYPVHTITKQGKRGKAYSLIEGFEAADNDLIAMIDADLQYAPEEIAEMYNVMQNSQVDVVVTRRNEKKVSAIRKLSTKVFNLIFAKLLFGIDFDTQSGLKLFKKDVLTRFTMKPSPWSFDLEFIVRSLENKFTIASHNIQFDEREFGTTKVKLLSTTFELAKASLQLRWRTPNAKVRAGYRANDTFMKHAFRALVLGSLLTIGLLSMNGAKTSALSLQAVAPTNTTAGILSPIVDPIVHLFEGGSKSTQAALPTPVTAPATPVLTTAPPMSSSPIQPQSMPMTSNTNLTSQTYNTSNSQNTTPVSHSSTSTASTIPTTSSSVPSKPTTADSNSLSAATPVRNKTSIYANGFPYYRLSGHATHLILNFVKIAAIAGASCALAAILGIIVRNIRRAKSHKSFAWR